MKRIINLRVSYDLFVAQVVPKLRKIWAPAQFLPISEKSERALKSFYETPKNLSALKSLKCVSTKKMRIDAPSLHHHPPIPPFRFLRPPLPWSLPPSLPSIPVSTTEFLPFNPGQSFHLSHSPLTPNHTQSETASAQRAFSRNPFSFTSIQRSHHGCEIDKEWDSKVCTGLWG